MGKQDVKIVLKAEKKRPSVYEGTITLNGLRLNYTVLYDGELSEMSKILGTMVGRDADERSRIMQGILDNFTLEFTRKGKAVSVESELEEKIKWVHIMDVQSMVYLKSVNLEEDDISIFNTKYSFPHKTLHELIEKLKKSLK